MVNIGIEPIGRSERDRADDEKDARAEALFKAKFEEQPETLREEYTNLGKQLHPLEAELKVYQGRRKEVQRNQGSADALEGVNATIKSLEESIAKVKNRRAEILKDSSKEWNANKEEAA